MTPQGVVTVRELAVLDETIRDCPAPVPAVITTYSPCHWLATQVFDLSLRVVAVLVPEDVPRVVGGGKAAPAAGVTPLLIRKVAWVVPVGK